jgi:hypothetical protein
MGNHWGLGVTLHYMVSVQKAAGPIYHHRRHCPAALAVLTGHYLPRTKEAGSRPQAAQAHWLHSACTGSSVPQHTQLLQLHYEALAVCNSNGTHDTPIATSGQAPHNSRQ